LVRGLSSLSIADRSDALDFLKQNRSLGLKIDHEKIKRDIEHEPSRQFWETFGKFEASCTSFTVGRGGPSELVFLNFAVSRTHAKVHFEDGIPYITDLSTNGTWVNGEKLVKGKAQPLIRDQLVSFGEGPSNNS
ncbi:MULTISPECIES: FHA domain-containing protein, partial [unclassified Caballeronia]|uniref:FHA domain-containing protein n=1 Tax=unclassified Caballeronia TaxID=2646786 RepID=UPI0020294A72